VGETKGSQLVLGGGVTRVTTGSNLLPQRAGFHTYMVQFEVTNKAQAYVLARLLRIEMAQGEDATPIHASGLGTRVSDLAGFRRVCNALLF
jgi:hypothetical protein